MPWQAFQTWQCNHFLVQAYDKFVQLWEAVERADAGLIHGWCALQVHCCHIGRYLPHDVVFV